MNAHDDRMTDSSAPGSRPAPRASVIIPHLNTPDLLDRCLRSVFGQTLDHGWFEVLVVDNGSRPDLQPHRERWPDAIFLAEPTPGPGPARNLGVRNARADILVFIDADCRAGDRWLQVAVDAVEHTPGLPAGGDVRIDFRDPACIEGIEAFEAVFSFRQKMYVERKHFTGGGNLACSRETFAAVGDFSGIEKSEDVDWGHRATAIGRGPYYIDDMRIYHPARPSVEALNQRWRRIVAHKWYAQQKTLPGRLKWQAYAFGVLCSPAVHSFFLLLSPRIPSFGGRLRAIPVLLSQRWNRFLEMQRVAFTGDSSSARKWNRA